jgi:ATP-dependent DNA ligase
MEPESTVREIAAAWEPQRPGRRAAKDIEDALVEPAWGGVRVAAALTVDEAALYRAGEELETPAEILSALVEAFTAVDAVVEGHLTTRALRDDKGVGAAMPKVERPPLLIPRGLFKSVRDDPYVKARDYANHEAELARSVLEAIADGVPHAFVATDLLWLDGNPLQDIPLLERRRLLEGALRASDLVRVTPVVKRTAILTLVTWGQLGFSEISYRGANSRYAAGQENPDWAVGRPPDGPQGPTATPKPAR